MSRRTPALLVVVGLAVGLLGLVLSVAGSVGATPLPQSSPESMESIAAPTLASTSSLTVAIAAEPDSLDPALTCQR
ncbi:MAG: hypothetical protein HY870_14660 [Chloroflexi bacterium]|nr:hypothetical protein [Chloroflexota bacterium]